MGSFQPTKTLLLLAATESSSWSFHLSSMFVGMMFSGVCLGKVVTFLGRHHTESVQFQQVVDFLESGCVDFFLSVSDSSSYTTPLLSLGLGATQKARVSTSHTAIPSIASKVVESCPVTASALPCTKACAFGSNLGFNWKHCQVVAGGYQRIRRGCRGGCIRRIVHKGTSFSVWPTS